MPKNSIFNIQQHTYLRKDLRHNLTYPERKLWSALKHRQLGIKFRRQHGIGRYIVDFYCASLCMAIELDGNSHFNTEAIQYDRIRDDYLKSLGIHVIRIWNSDVMGNIDGVLAMLEHEIKNLALRQPPP